MVRWCEVGAAAAAVDTRLPMMPGMRPSRFAPIRPLSIVVLLEPSFDAAEPSSYFARAARSSATSVA